jgi:hypothetical protein
MNIIILDAFDDMIAETTWSKWMRLIYQFGKDVIAVSDTIWNFLTETRTIDLTGGSIIFGAGWSLLGLDCESCVVDFTWCDYD